MSHISSREKLRTTIRTVFDKRTEQRLFRANLGKGDGTGTVIAPQIGYSLSVFYYQQPGSGQNIGVAQLSALLAQGGYYSNNPAFENIEFWIGYPAGSAVLTVLYPTQAGYIAAGSGPVVAQQNTLQTQVNNAGILSFYASPTSPASKMVQVAAGDYVNSGSGALLNFIAATIDLSGTITALTAGKHQLAWISLDCSTGLLQVTTNTAKTATGTLPSRSEWQQSDITGITVSTSYAKIIPVYLYNGQASIVELDFYRAYDARLPLRPLAAAGGGGSGNQIYAMAMGWMGV